LRQAVSEDRFNQYCKGAACHFAIDRQKQIDLFGTAIQAGERIDFSEDGTATNYTTGGWHAAEASHTWTSGHRATLKVASLPTGLLWPRLYMCASAFMADVHPPVVQVTINEHIVKRIRITSCSKKIFRIGLPRTIVRRLRTQPVEIGINVDNPISPKSIGKSKDDGRILGLAIHWMEFAG
jgi:hypothetical protein